MVRVAVAGRPVSARVHDVWDNTVQTIGRVLVNPADDSAILFEGC
jgi:hypothetical protein